MGRRFEPDGAHPRGPAHNVRGPYFFAVVAQDDASTGEHTPRSVALVGFSQPPQDFVIDVVDGREENFVGTHGVSGEEPVGSRLVPQLESELDAFGARRFDEGELFQRRSPASKHRRADARGWALAVPAGR